MTQLMILLDVKPRCQVTCQGTYLLDFQDLSLISTLGKTSLELSNVSSSVYFDTQIICTFWIQIGAQCVFLQEKRGEEIKVTICEQWILCTMIPQWLLYNTKWFGQIRTIFQSLLADYQCSQQKDLLLPAQKRQFNSDNSTELSLSCFRDSLNNVFSFQAFMGRRPKQ